MPTEVTRRDGPLKSKRFQKFFQKPVTYKQIILFSKQFRTLFNAGVSITQLLGILQTQTENPTDVYKRQAPISSPPPKPSWKRTASVWTAPFPALPTISGALSSC